MTQRRSVKRGYKTGGKGGVWSTERFGRSLEGPLFFARRLRLFIGQQERRGGRRSGLRLRHWVSVGGFIRGSRSRRPLMPRAATVGSGVLAGAGCSGRWRRVWARQVFPWGFVPEPRLRLLPGGDSEVPTPGSGQAGPPPVEEGK